MGEAWGPKPARGAPVLCVRTRARRRPRRPPVPDPHELPGRPAERHAELARPQVVAVERVVEVDADAPVQVLGGVGDAVAALGRPELGDRHRLLGVLALGEAMDGAEQGESDRLDVDVGVAGALVHCLEAADRAVELPALGGVGGRHLQRALGHAEGHRAERRRGVLAQPAGGLGAALGGGEHVLGRNACARQLEHVLGLVVGHLLAHELDARGARVEQEQAHAARGARRHHDALGELRGGDEALAAVERERGAVLARRGGGLLGQLGERLRERAAQDRLAAGDARQEALLLRIAAEAGDRQTCQHDRRVERHRRHRAADLLEQHDQLEEAHAAAAVALLEGHAQQVGLGELLPELAVDPVVARLDRLQPLVGDELFQDLARQLAQRLLVLAPAPVHLRLL